MFVHKGVSHILGNILMQLLLGLPLEVVHKWRIVVVYLCGVLAGSLGTSLTTPNIFLVGASAGVYALLTAHLATIFLVSFKCNILVTNRIFLFTELETNGLQMDPTSHHPFIHILRRRIYHIFRNGS